MPAAAKSRDESGLSSAPGRRRSQSRRDSAGRTHNRIHRLFRTLCFCEILLSACPLFVRSSLASPTEMNQTNNPRDFLAVCHIKYRMKEPHLGVSGTVAFVHRWTHYLGSLVSTGSCANDTAVHYLLQRSRRPALVQRYALSQVDSMSGSLLQMTTRSWLHLNAKTEARPLLSPGCVRPACRFIAELGDQERERQDSIISASGRSCH